MSGDNIWHLIDVLVPAVMIVGMWLDSRRRATDQHKENSERLVSIETKIEPVWQWFINGRNK